MTKGKAAGAKTANPLKRLAYIYVGTSSFDEDHDSCEKKLGAHLVWEFEEFGARVAAFDLCGEPYLLLADHVEAPSKRLIYEVDDLDEAAEELKARGWRPDGGRFEVPRRAVLQLQGRERERLRDPADEQAPHPGERVPKVGREARAWLSRWPGRPPP